MIVVLVVVVFVVAGMLAVVQIEAVLLMTRFATAASFLQLLL